MDGFGHNPSDYGNAIHAAKKPNLDKYMQGPNTLIGASGLDVGLPDGQMGNSEVGHTNIGAGRIVYQMLVKITKDIEDGKFFENPAISAAMDTCKEKGTALHLMGLLSPGGVHSHISHLYGLLEMAKQKGLGKGLGALLGEESLRADTPAEGAVSTLPLQKIEPNPLQPRKTFAEEELDALAESIRIHGIIQPLTVRLLPNGYYQIIAGERRWRAARLAGLSQVPVVVIEADDRKAMELAMIENLQREDLNPIEEAEGYQVLMSQYGMTQEETAQRVGKSRSAVANALRLLHLCPPVRAMVEDGRLTNGHARAILPLSPEMQETAADTIIKNDLSVRQTELLVKKLTAEKKETPPSTSGVTVNYAEEAARELGSHLGRGCKIVSGRKKGRIELEYYGLDDLNALLDLLNQLHTK